MNWWKYQNLYSYYKNKKFLKKSTEEWTSLLTNDWNNCIDKVIFVGTSLQGKRVWLHERFHLLPLLQVHEGFLPIYKDIFEFHALFMKLSTTLKESVFGPLYRYIVLHCIQFFLESILGISGSTHKELESQHFSLLSKKLNRLKSQHFLDSEEKTEHRENHSPQDWEDRQLQELWFTRAETHESKQSQNQWWGRRNWTVIDKWLETQCLHIWELKNAEN